MQGSEQKSLVFTVSLDMANMILKALSAQPYEQVAGIISSIQQQAAAQLQPAPVVVPEESTE